MENRWFRPEYVKSIPKLLDESTHKYASKAALIYFGKKISYWELHDLSLRTASFVVDNSSPDARVAILMPNIPQFIVCYYGILRTGRIAVPINFLSIADDLKSKPTNKILVSEEIAAQLKNSKPSIIFVADFLYPILRQVELNWLHRIVVVSISKFLPFFMKLLYLLKALKEGMYAGTFPNDVLKLEQVLKKCKPYLGDYPTVGDIAQIQYTGGTTDMPKGAMLTHKNLVSNFLQAREHLGELIRDNHEVVLGALPFFHIYGLTVAINATLLSFGGTTVLMPSFSPKKAMQSIKKYRITLFPGINRMYQSMVGYTESLYRLADLSSLKLCISGAGRIDASTWKRFKELSATEFVEGYGLSETSPIISVTLPSDTERPGPEKGNLVGKVLPETEVKILDIDNGSELTTKNIGIITVRGPQVMSGYYNNPKATAEVLKNGWFNTGDIGYLDLEGNLYFVDRIKDVVKRRGENIHASNIEKVLANCPLIAEAAVLGLNDVKDGEVPVACVVLKNNSENNEAEISKAILLYMRSNVPYLEVPAKVFIFLSLDKFKNPMGKLLKRKLKEEVLARVS